MNKKSKDKLFKVTISKTRLTAHPQLTEGAQCSPRQVGVMEMVAVRELLGRGLGRARLCRTSPAAATHGPGSAPPPAQNSDTPLCVTRIFQKI